MGLETDGDVRERKYDKDAAMGSLPFLIYFTLIIIVSMLVSVEMLSHSWSDYHDFISDASCSQNGSELRTGDAGSCRIEKIRINRIVMTSMSTRRNSHWVYRYFFTDPSGESDDVAGPIETSFDFNKKYLLHKQIPALLFRGVLVALYPTSQPATKLYSHPERPFKEACNTAAFMFFILVPLCGWILSVGLRERRKRKARP